MTELPLGRHLTSSLTETGTSGEVLENFPEAESGVKERSRAMSFGFKVRGEKHLV